MTNAQRFRKDDGQPGKRIARQIKGGDQSGETSVDIAG